ncbi:MAG TPA: YCF48-related protein [Candidatus Binatia bacterium]
MRTTRRALVVLLLVASGWTAGCHPEVEVPPLPEAKISIIGDRFFDVKAMSAERALIIGYRGKILETNDSGRTWNVIPSPTDRALYNIRFADAQHGWICGQAGLILATNDAGKTWTEQHSNTDQYLFAIYPISATHLYAVGDKSTVVETNDGGTTWRPRKIEKGKEGVSADIALAVQDPIFYDVEFTDPQNGWIVGEFGTIRHTADGGQTWTEQQESLLGEGIVDIFDLPTLFGVHFVNAQEGVAAGLEGKIAHTHDGGQKWAFDKVDEAVPIEDPLYSPFMFPDGHGWAVGSGGEVVSKDTPDAPWKRAKLGMRLFTWLRGIDFYDQNNGWIVGGFGTILKTKDGGKTWTPSVA